MPRRACARCAASRTPSSSRDTTQAEELYRRALDVQAALARDNPGNGGLRLDLARSRYFLGDLELKAGNTAAALEHFARALEDYETPEVVGADPRRARFGAAATHFRTGSACFTAGDLTRETAQAVAAADRANVAAREGVLIAQVALGTTLMAVGRGHEARDLFNRALSLAEQSPAQNRGSQARSFAANAYHGLGLLHLERARAGRGAGSPDELRTACSLLAKSRHLARAQRDTGPFQKGRRRPRRRLRQAGELSRARGRRPLKRSPTASPPD